LLESVFDDEFRGAQKYLTTCLTCLQTSEREEALDELHLHIKGKADVASCLEQYQATEHLSGDSQYRCDLGCGGQKRDATRQLVITRLPQVLWVQLMRYEYNKVTWDKEKLKDCVAVNESLDAEAVLRRGRPAAAAAAAVPAAAGYGGGGADSKAAASTSRRGGSGRGRSQTPPPPPHSAAPSPLASSPSTTQQTPVSDSPFDLVGVVEHRGVTANNGHYVARNRDWLAPRGGANKSTAKEEEEGHGSKGLANVAAFATQSCEECEDVVVADTAAVIEGPAANAWWLFDDTEVTKAHIPAVVGSGGARGSAEVSAATSSSGVEPINVDDEEVTNRRKGKPGGDDDEDEDWNGDEDQGKKRKGTGRGASEKKPKAAGDCLQNITRLPNKRKPKVQAAAQAAEAAGKVSDSNATRKGASAESGATAAAAAAAAAAAITPAARAK